MRDRLTLKILSLAQVVIKLDRDERVERNGADWSVRRRAPSEGFRDARVESAETDERDPGLECVLQAGELW